MRGKVFGTINHHLRAAKAFCNWFVKEHRIAENPLAHITLLNAKADRRLERRALLVAEIGRLLAAAEVGEPTHDMTDTDRALLYRFALAAGFRWSECYSLTRASFNFASEPATGSIKARDAKNEKADILPLRPELAAAFSGARCIAKTGTADLPAFPQVRNLMDTPRDTLPLDQDGKVWTYRESEMPRITTYQGGAEIQKSLCLPRGNRAS